MQEDWNKQTANYVTDLHFLLNPEYLVGDQEERSCWFTQRWEWWKGGVISQNKLELICWTKPNDYFVHFSSNNTWLRLQQTPKNPSSGTGGYRIWMDWWTTWLLPPITGSIWNGTEITKTRCSMLGSKKAMMFTHIKEIILTVCKSLFFIYFFYLVLSAI